MVVDAILVTYRRTEPLVASCEAALGQDCRIRTLTVVDNGGEGLARSQLARTGLLEDLRLMVRDAPGNLGPTGGFNLGLEEIGRNDRQPDWVLFLDDDDPLAHPSLVGRLVAEASHAGGDSLAGVGLLGGRFFAPLLLPRSVEPADGPLTPVDCLFGNHAPLYRPAALRSVGGFRPELFWGHEELDLGLRLRRAGWNLAWASRLYASLPKAPKDLVRTGKPRLGVEPPSPSRYYVFRNTLYIGRSYPKPYLALTVLARGILKPLLGIVTRPRAALGALRQNMRACRDALGGEMGRTVSLEERDAGE